MQLYLYTLWIKSLVKALLEQLSSSIKLNGEYVPTASCFGIFFKKYFTYEFYGWEEKHRHTT